jgi:N-methylhydantoinase B/oxoprolinase/acetone carboxylase alpha subunit
MGQKGACAKKNDARKEKRAEIAAENARKANETNADFQARIDLYHSILKEIDECRRPVATTNWDKKIQYSKACGSNKNKQRAFLVDHIQKQKTHVSAYEDKLFDALESEIDHCVSVASHVSPMIMISDFIATCSCIQETIQSNRTVEAYRGIESQTINSLEEQWFGVDLVKIKGLVAKMTNVHSSGAV